MLHAPCHMRVRGLHPGLAAEAGHVTRHAVHEMCAHSICTLVLLRSSQDCAFFSYFAPFTYTRHLEMVASFQVGRVGHACLHTRLHARTPVRAEGRRCSSIGSCAEATVADFCACTTRGTNMLPFFTGARSACPTAPALMLPQAAVPELVRLQVLGKSLQGRDIDLLQIGGPAGTG